MSILLALASAAAPAAGSNIGGAFLGAQAGVVYNRIKFKAVENAITKEAAEAAYSALAGLTDFATKDTTGTTFDATTAGLKDDTYTIKVDFSKLDNTNDDNKKAAAQTLRAEFDKALANGKFKTVKVIAKLPSSKAMLWADLTAQDALKNFGSDDAKKAAVDARVQQDNEVKYTGTTGLVGLHAGYLHKFSPCFGLGALVEGSWSFSQDLKLEGKDKETDFSPRFGVNGLVRAVYFATPKFFFGADVGVGLQEFRYVNGTKADAKTDSKSKSDSKDSKWGWNLVGHALAGMAINDNVVVTAKVGGGFPVKDQDWKERGDRKFRYYDVQGTLGLSYYLGA